MSVGADLAGSLTGNIESAYVIVHDLRKSANALPLAPDVVRQALGGGDNALKKGAAVDKRFRVQYNPSELSIYSTTETLEKIGAQKRGDGKDDTLVESPIGARMELSTNLVFDHMTIANSFMMEKNLLPTHVSGIANIASMASTDKFTVQTEVEGFISALRNIYTQTITFCWADFSFTGTLLHVGAQYTMFSMAGHPVRAKVALRLRCESRGDNMQAWIDDFNTAFGGDKSSLVLPEQRASNLLNLGL